MAASAALFVFLGLAYTVRGGTGVVTSKEDGSVVDITVFFDDAGQDVGKWTANFNQTHKMLWKASRGMMRFGKVRMGSDRSLRGRADIVVDKVGHASVAQSPDRERTSLGTDDTMYLFEEDRDAPIVTLHELGHYVFCLSDEYKSDIWARVGGVDKVVEKGDEDTSFCSVERASPGDSTKNPSHSCLMYENNYPNIYYLFCAEEHLTRNNLAGGRWAVTDQQKHNGKSCAGTVAALFGLASLPGARADDPPDAPTIVSLKPEVRCGVFIQGDLSGAELQRAKLEAAAAVRRLRLPGVPRSGDSAGVATFTAAVQDVFPWKNLQTQADIDAAVAAVDGVATQAGPVDLEVALRAQMTSIAGGGYDFATKTILLYTNGPGVVSQALIDDLRRSDVVVSVLALADNANARAMRSLATQTGGVFIPVGGAAEPAGGAERFLADGPDYSDSAEVAGGYVIARFAGRFNPGAPVSHSLPVDTLNGEVAVTFSSGGGPLALSLKDPSGANIDLDNPPDHVWVQRTDTQVQVQVDSPDPGNWTALVDGAAPSAYTLELSGEGEPMGEADVPDLSQFPAAATLHLRVENGFAVAGCQVQATVTRPDGTTAALPLYDDGDRAFHADRRANDGIYSAFVAQYPVSGVYDVAFLVENKTGQYTTAFDGIDLPPGSHPPGPVGPAPAFQRLVMDSFVVEGVPSGGGAALLPPGNLSLESPAPGQVALSWADTSGGRASTVVRRSVGGQDNYMAIAELGPGVINYVDVLKGETGQLFYQLYARAAAGQSSPGDAESIAPIVMGDLSSDGAVNSVDLDVLMNTVVGNIPPGVSPCFRPDAGDWDGDGVLTASDLITMSRRLAGAE